MTIIISPDSGFSGVPAIYETASIQAVGAGGTVNFNLLDQSVLQYTSNATSNWTFNVRGNSSISLGSVMTAGQATTVTFILTQGLTPYYATGFTIDGVGYAPLWQGVAPTSGFASSTEIYTYAILKTTTGYNVFATRTRFS
jgi:hypothetical protein